MEKLNKVIAGLECCLDEDRSCRECPYDKGCAGCLDDVMADALEVLREYSLCLTGCGIRQYCDAHMDEEVADG